MAMSEIFDTVVSKMKSVAESTMPKGTTVVLYGSRARGEAKTDSDWDVLILLDKDKVEVQDYDDIAFPFTDLGWELGQAIIPIMYTKKNWNSLSYLPFHKNVEHDKYVIYES